MANRKKNQLTLRMNQITPGTQVKGATLTGGSQPPKNSTVNSAHMLVMATYSPSMNNKYWLAEYSTMKPATSSDSASTRSKGGRLVSARAEMKKITNIGNSGSQYQPKSPNRVSCAVTMSLRLSEPAQSSTV